jgi:hypothetical protein
MIMFRKSMQSSLVIAGLLAGGLCGFVSQAGATTGDARVTGKTVFLAAKQGAVEIPIGVVFGDAGQEKVPVIRVAPECPGCDEFDFPWGHG